MNPRYLLSTLSALLIGCSHPAPTPPAPTDPNALRFLALGDSYTSGESIPESQRWPVQLSAALRRAGVNITDPTIIARTGWTTEQLAKAMDTATLSPPYDLVALLIGVNNQYQGRSEAEYRKQFADLLSRSIQLAGNRPTRVIVLSIPDWGVTPYAKQMAADPHEVATAIDHFNAINKELTAAANAVYIDITPLTRNHPDLVADDGLHPTGDMYAKWVELALPLAQKAVQR